MNDISKLIRGHTTIQVPSREKPKAERTESVDKAKYYTHRRARLNIIPTPDELSRMINNALEALSKGVYWDRGSIVNILL